MDIETRADPLVDLSATHARAMAATDEDGQPYLYVGDGEAAVALQHDPLHAHEAAEALLRLADETRAYALGLLAGAEPVQLATTPVGTPWLHGPLNGPIGWPGL